MGITSLNGGGGGGGEGVLSKCWAIPCPNNDEPMT